MLAYLCPLTVDWRLASGVCPGSEVIELTDEREDRTSDTGATPNDDSISSRSLRELIVNIKHMLWATPYFLVSFSPATIPTLPSSIFWRSRSATAFLLISFSSLSAWSFVFLRSNSAFLSIFDSCLRRSKLSRFADLRRRRNRCVISKKFHFAYLCNKTLRD